MKLRETARIFSDFDFLKTTPTQEQFQERIKRYKKIMLVLAGGYG